MRERGVKHDTCTLACVLTCFRPEENGDKDE